MTDTIDCAVIGAGVVGLAVARALALRGREVAVLEAAEAIGTGTSSRNSEVIHAGIYYPQGSLKARLCVEGNRMLRRYCAERGVAHRMLGKLIVAANDDEVPLLSALADKAHANGVHDLRWVEARQAREMEPELACAGALLSPSTGIIDSHALMLSLQGEVEAHGGAVAFLSPVAGGSAESGGVRLEVGGREPTALVCHSVVNCAGLGAQAVSRGLGAANVPPLHLCKGNYFTLTGRTPFRHLVYPVPGSAGLGTHFTLDLAGRSRFGPDVEWVERADYRVDPARATAFYADIRRYWPRLADGALEPGYAGIRPKVQAPGEPAQDFLIHGPRQHGIAGLVALYGIESPGLTACLALAEHVAELAA